MYEKNRQNWRTYVTGPWNKGGVGGGGRTSARRASALRPRVGCGLVILTKAPEIEAWKACLF